MSHRVAITGIGIISSIGNSISEVSNALYAGTSGITTDDERRTLGFLSPLTGRIQDFTPTLALSRKQKKTMPEFAQWSAEAAHQAITHAQLEEHDLASPRTGIIFGCDSSCLAAIEQTSKLLESKSTTSLGSGLVFQSMTSCISMNLNVLFKTQGACWTISSACSSGAHVVGQAANLIRLGQQDRIICGAAQEINWQSMCSFDGLGAFSANPIAKLASRPFDKSRDGLVPSGGAAALILEDYALAQKRNTPILGEICSYGFSSDGEGLSVPSSSGLGRAMKMALDGANLSTKDITYLCAHATSTPTGDAREAENIVSLFGKNTVPVSSTKSMTGHELWMSGASQVVYSCLMAQNNFIAPNINFSEPDEWSHHLSIVPKTTDTRHRYTLCNSAGFGGTNASLILGF